MAKKLGVTNISACFNYLGSPCGDCFNQGVQITNSGSALLGGTVLDIIFYQGGVPVDLSNLKSMETIINVVDNSTRNLVTSKNIYLNGIEIINATPTFELGKHYELRAVSYGYVDKVVNFNVSAAQLTLLIDPKKDLYYVGDIINLSSNIENSTFLLDGVTITMPYTLLSPGNFALRVDKEGYISSEFNITISNVVTYNSLYPSDLTKWKKGDKVILKLTEDSIWNVYYSEEYKNKETNALAYKEPVIIKTGIGGEVSFEIKGNGYYEVKSKKEVSSQETSVLKTLITQKNLVFSEFFNKYKIWIISVCGLLIAVIILLFVTSGNKSRGVEKASFGGSSSSPSEMESVVSYD
jgi:hypothetical protein